MPAGRASRSASIALARGGDARPGAEGRGLRRAPVAANTHDTCSFTSTAAPTGSRSPAPDALSERRGKPIVNCRRSALTRRCRRSSRRTSTGDRYAVRQCRARSRRPARRVCLPAAAAIAINSTRAMHRRCRSPSGARRRRSRPTVAVRFDEGSVRVMAALPPVWCGAPGRRRARSVPSLLTADGDILTATERGHGCAE